MDGIDIEIEWSGRACIGGVAGSKGNAVNRKVLDMQRPPRSGIHQRDIDAGDWAQIVEAHRKGLVTRRLGRRMEFEQSRDWLAVDQNLRLRADTPDDRTIARHSYARRRQPSR